MTSHSAFWEWAVDTCQPVSLYTHTVKQRDKAGTNRTPEATSVPAEGFKERSKSSMAIILLKFPA
jgi:hypothetical protein